MDNSNNFFKKGLKYDFKFARFIFIILFASNILFFALYIVEKFKNSIAPEHLMVIDNEGAPIFTKKTDLSIDYLKLEAENHLISYIKLIYENDQYTFEKNIQSSIDLATNDIAYMVKDEQNANQVLTKLQKFNARSTVDVDSIGFDNNLKGSIVFTQNIITTEDNKDIIKRTRKSFDVKISRTGNKRNRANPHAMLITKFELTNVEKLN